MKKLALISGLATLAATLFFGSSVSFAQGIQQTKGSFEDKFRQLDEVLPTPNVYRTASGQPGHQYWQQEVDYNIDVTLDENTQRISGTETITYQNNSPDTLSYLWLQLDQNRFRADSMGQMSSTFNSASPEPGSPARLSLNQLRRLQYMEDADHGYEIRSIRDVRGNDLSYTVVGTLLRLDLERPLRSGQDVEFVVDYAFNMVDGEVLSPRGGYEYFPDDEKEGGNYLFAVSQWFPRLVAYTDYEGWTNREFLGSGEFTLEFGDYEVAITVPSDHIVAATGELQNANQVLSREQRDRLQEAETADRPVFIVTPEEALENEREGVDDTKTWRFAAENVRDFAWGSSRKFIWDAKGHHQPGAERELVMAMSFYPREGGTLWSDYSTEVVIHTLEVYSRFSFDFPYPTAQSLNAGFLGGMEYPMMTFNGPRTTLQDDGTRTYSLSEKRFLIGVVIHEVGHFYFPMIVNSDERQWTWMDEGINSYLDSVAGREWDAEIPWGVEPKFIVDYMVSQNQVPIMTQSDSVLRLGSNAYAKPATALNILRETIMGRELFDFAFKEYSKQWKFKRPTPSDFFRIMEEASGVDLDWFFRGWFYTTDHVDISLDRVYQMQIDTENPDIDYSRQREIDKALPPSLYIERNRNEGRLTWVDRNTDVRDFYDDNDQFTVTNKERNSYNSFLEGLEDWERAALDRAVSEDLNYYILEFSNVGGLVMPIILEVEYANGSKEEIRLPAEIWRRSPHQVKKLLVVENEIINIIVDPQQETSDADIENNYYPRRIIPSRIESFKSEGRGGLLGRDIMQDIKTELKTEDDEDEDN
ncbi:MAG: aminopeptidase [SAR86 cluster bacterium]|uniref:Aminopeptidase n=1 Tax=SAR86 cluster bacterium TaxID=2030880 RepID=A0A2A5B8I3_9GAMM|nr:MAG: aminopeptidase [SAR86 cluster bacterium]